jgi:arsenate reductase
MKLKLKKSSPKSFATSPPLGDGGLTILHKTNCSTSLKALALLKDNTDEAIEVIEYIKETPTAKELKAILKMIGIKAHDFLRKKEPLYKENFADKKFTEAQWIKVMVTNPILIERPVIIKDGRAIIGRPPESVIAFLKSFD